MRALRGQGHTVRVFAGEDAMAMFANEPGGAEPVASTPLGVGPSALRIIANRLGAASNATRAQRPDVLVTDGDLPSALTARLQRVPSVALGHGLVFAHCRRVPDAPRGPWLREAAKARLASVGASRVVAVNFAPCVPRDPRTTVVARPTLRANLGVRASDIGDDAPIVCYFRDDNGDAVLRWLVELGFRPLVFTNRKVDIPGAVVVRKDSDRFAQELLRARAVVSSAGSQLISECQALGIPQFALYAPGDDEQLLNVAMLRHFGLGDGAPLDAANRGMLRAFLEQPQPATSDRPAPAVDAVTAVCDAVADLCT